MASLPATYDVASGFVARPAGDAFEYVSDLSNWPVVFPSWIARVEEDDKRWRVTGPAKEKYDFYPQADGAELSLDVEVVDELGSGDVLRLRVLEMPGGALILIAHGKLSGTSDAAWSQKRDGISGGLQALELSA